MLTIYTLIWSVQCKPTSSYICKRNNSPYPSNYELPVVSQNGVGSKKCFSVFTWILAVLILCRSCAGNLSCREAMIALAMSFPDAKPSFLSLLVCSLRLGGCGQWRYPHFFWVFSQVMHLSILCYKRYISDQGYTKSMSVYISVNTSETILYSMPI